MVVFFPIAAASCCICCHAPKTQLLSADLAVEVFILHQTFDAHVGFTIGTEHLLASLLDIGGYRQKRKTPHLLASPRPNCPISEVAKSKPILRRASFNDVVRSGLNKENKKNERDTNFTHPVTLRDGIF